MKLNPPKQQAGHDTVSSWSRTELEDAWRGAILPLSAPSQPRPGRLPSHKLPSKDPSGCGLSSPTHPMGLLLTTLLLSERLNLFGTPCGSN
ncbi:hypothetical protein GDO81_027186 [Engystomops pustulosus]|uniref:Uncharacterized protein n=1 Tax=Engystomops pustulosus TaxID=76066 RepID=A0AAV6YPV9_ENGPU|nr:hypothetical protein GDO81_027186 [Engystomops pustulosus]